MRRDSFLDPRTWPEVEEIHQLRAIWGRSAVEDGPTVAPLGHPPVTRDADADRASP